MAQLLQFHIIWKEWRPPFPQFSSMLGQQKSDVWMRGANIETGGGREGGKYVSANGILQPNACEN